MGDFSERFNALSPKKQELLRLLRAEKAKAAALSPTIPRRAPGDSAPLSFAQERLWFLDQLQPGSAFYNEPVAVRLTGALDVAALHQSLNAIVRRHETLRTTFARPESVGESPRQVIAPALTIDLPVLDLRGLPAAEREAEAERLGAAEVARPFDLTAGPLLRAMLLRLTANDHIALLTCHHIIFDGWSAGVLVQELATFYAAFAAGNASALPDLPIQYADYAVWQREWLHPEGTREMLERQLDYWRQQLQDAPPTLDLPTDYPRPALQSFRGARETIKLSPVLSESLKALSQCEDATLFMTLLSAFNVLLYRYSGQADLCVGTRIAGRSQVATERLIGFFLNALVLRADLSGNPAFRELLGRVRETALGAYAHQDLPFEKLVQELRPERSLSHQPLFQVMFVLQNAPMPPLELPNLTLRPLKFGGGTAKLDLDLAMIEETDGLSGLLEYNTDIFSAATIRRMLDQFQVLLAAIVADPDQRIDRLPLLTVTEQHTLLVEWNATRADYPHDRCLHELFAEQARRTPDAVAIAYRDQRLTFAELDWLANQVAHRLQALGIGPDVPVGVLIERSHKTVVALLGILKAGGCYVPLDPAYPQAHLAFVLADTQVPVIIAEERLLGRLPEYRAAVLPVDDSWSAVAVEPTHPPITTVTPDHLFYIMYTSGSTGQPKGVMVAQRQLLNRFAWMWRRYPFAPGEIMCQRTTVNFTVSIWELLGPLLRGVPTVVIPDEVVRDARVFVQTLADAQVTRIVLVPSLLQMIFDSGLDLERLLGRLTLWSVCGEALSLDLARRFRELLPNAVLLNQYGASEMNDTAVFDTRLQPANRSFVPLGRPIPNLQIYLLDHQLQPVPIGVPGALHVGSVSLSRGYLNQPALTAEKFIPHPFSLQPGARLYNTGDLARYHADGTLEYLGRRDHQVKIRGVRVELGEIDAVLKQHPGVGQAVVVARADGVDERQIVAYVVENKEPGAMPRGRPAHKEQKDDVQDSCSLFSVLCSPQELRQFLRERLPASMVPASIVLLDALPRTPNGKIDRKALPAPEALRSESDEQIVAPRTEVERQIAAIMGAVLRREQIGVLSNFFDLGGHSLLATQVISRIRDTFEIDLPLRTIFETPTVAGLAAQIERGRSEAGALQLPLLPVARDRELPLSFAQQRLWFLDQLEPNSPFYNVPAAVRLSGALDRAALERALDTIVQRHETLRTTFAVRSAEQGVAEPAQVIAPQLRIDLPLLDLQALEEAEREAEVERITVEEARQPFDLRRGPLIRARLLRLDPREHVLLLTLHHIISDGWSTRVLVRELTNLYTAFSQGRQPSLAPLPIQYADYAVWQRESVSGAVLESQIEYWRQQLADVPLLDLPLDSPRPAIQDFRGQIQSLILPNDLTSALRTLSQREGVTLFMTLLAVFDLLLSRHSGQTDIVVGAPIAGRTRAETEPLIGFFANTLVLRTDLAAAPTFRDLLGRVRAVALDAYAHQDVPFEKLVEVLQPARDLSRNPFFDVLFNYMDAAQLTLEAPGLTLTPIQTELGSKFAMTLYVDEYADAIGLRLLYQRALFAPERIAVLLDQLQHLLAQIVAAPEQPLDAYSLVTPSARTLLPDPAIELPEPRYEPATTLFQACARRWPEQPALRQDNRVLAYGDLAIRVDDLARQLLACGLRRGDVVAVSGPRSFGLIASMLASILSGGVMLTLDRNLPASRQRLMLDEANARFMLYVGQERAEDHWLHERESVAIVQVAADEARAVDPVAVDTITLPELTPDDHAYIFFTSGTTGVPKGVLGWHKGLSHFITWQRETFAIGPGDRSAQLTGLSFNVLLRDVFTPLISGATLCLPPAESAFGPADVLPWLEREQITMLHTVPSLVQSWLIAVPPGVSLRALRWIFSAGEPLTESLVRGWRAAFPQMRGTTVLLYGQTETTLAKCFFAIPDMIPPGVQPVGWTLPQTQALVLSADNRLCGIGEPGELALRTPYRTLGYFNAPEEQRRRFVPNPFRADDRDIVYLTGDRARYRLDGSLEVLGRADDQVKIRGIRVEPAEVQSWIGKHPAVRAAVVLVRKEESGEQRLVAYVVVEEQRTGCHAQRAPGAQRTKEQSTTGSPSPAAAGEGGRGVRATGEGLTSSLRAFLREYLPEYMIPAAFVFLDALPLTPNGKVDRQALPVPDFTVSERIFVPPRTPTEEGIARIFGEILQREEVGGQDHFFELGGHSLLATQALSRLREAFSIDLPLRTIFEKPTVAELALAIDHLKQTTAPARAPRITSRSRDQHRGLISSRDELTLPDVLKRNLKRED